MHIISLIILIRCILFDNAFLPISISLLFLCCFQSSFASLVTSVVFVSFIAFISIFIHFLQKLILVVRPSIVFALLNELFFPSNTPHVPLKYAFQYC